MSKQEKEEEKEEIDWSKYPPCTIEDIIMSNVATRKLLLKVKPKDSSEKKVFVEFRRLNIKEATDLAKLDYNKDGNEIYEKKLLYYSSIIPELPDPNDISAWNNIDHAFRVNYTRKINEFANENDFL